MRAAARAGRTGAGDVGTVAVTSDTWGVSSFARDIA
jgi:hypothetical protein